MNIRLGYRKLVGISFVALAALSACTDEIESNGNLAELAGRRIAFTVGMQESGTWARAGETRSASALSPVQELPDTKPVEMQGEINGKAVYLQAEITDCFPGDTEQPVTRGTQISNDNATSKMEAFGVSAYFDFVTTPNPLYMHNGKFMKDATGDTWTTEIPYFWPKRPLSFYAWYPYEGEGFSVSDANPRDYPTLSYTVPDDASKQKDVMWASTGTNTSLNFEHLLTAVKFVVGDDLPPCVIKRVTLVGVKYKGTCNFGNNRAWDLADGTKDFKQEWVDNVVEGDPDEAITAEGETFFMLPQTLPKGAKVVVTLNDGSQDFNVSAPIEGTEWPVGKAVTYRISHNFVSFTFSNRAFHAYTDEDIHNQLAFIVSFESSSPTDTATLLQVIRTEPPIKVTFSPNIFPSGTKNQPVYVTWTGRESENTQYLSTFMIVTKSGRPVRDYDDDGVPTYKYIANVGGIRETPAAGDSCYLYSLPETSSQPLTGITSIKNASKSDWIAMTTSPAYDGVDYRNYLINPTGGNVWLQTLSVPKENRMASFLASKTTSEFGRFFDNNVMLIVEQKAFTADFGFKGCERNISRESEKWNISVGGRFKNGTQLKARVVADAGQAGVTGDGSPTYGDDALITCTSTGGAESYVKKRWDTQVESADNNGERKVHLQIQTDNLGGWYDSEITGTMADWMTWGPNYVFANLGGTKFEAGQRGNAEISTLLGKVYNYSAVHANHPLFGSAAHQWKNVNREYNGYKERSQSHADPIYRFWANYKGSDYGVHGNRYQGGGFLTIAPAYNSYERYSATDGNNTYYFARGYREGNAGEYLKAGFFYIECSYGGSFPTTYGNERGSYWNNKDIYIWTIPIIYMPRPTDDKPITGTSVNE